jgi:hypothetical protein
LTLTLPLFVSRVAANDVDTSSTPHQLAIFTDALDARPNLHGKGISRSPETQFRQTVNLAIGGKGNKGENQNWQEFCMQLRHEFRQQPGLCPRLPYGRISCSVEYRKHHHVVVVSLIVNEIRPSLHRRFSNSWPNFRPAIGLFSNVVERLCNGPNET